MKFHYQLRDRRYGKIFDHGVIEAESKTDARKQLATVAWRDVPQGRTGARDLGYVPFRDWQIIWSEK